MSKTFPAWVLIFHQSELIPTKKLQSSAAVLQFRSSLKMAQTSLITVASVLITLDCASSFIYSGETLEGQYAPDLTQTCLGCICEATSNCNLTIGCRGRLCGPFLISKKYWTDAGRPVLYKDHPDRREAFEACVNDPFCAAQTFKQYMYRFAQDCNQNGIIDCDDYARIHYLGGRQCNLPIDQYCYYRVFRECQAVVRFLN